MAKRHKEAEQLRENKRNNKSETLVRRVKRIWEDTQEKVMDYLDRVNPSEGETGRRLGEHGFGEVDRSMRRGYDEW